MFEMRNCSPAKANRKEICKKEHRDYSSNPSAVTREDFANIPALFMRSCTEG